MAWAAVGQLRGVGLLWRARRGQQRQTHGILSWQRTSEAKFANALDYGLMTQGCTRQSITRHFMEGSQGLNAPQSTS